MLLFFLEFVKEKKMKKLLNLSLLSFIVSFLLIVNGCVAHTSSDDDDFDDDGSNDSLVTAFAIVLVFGCCVLIVLMAIIYKRNNSDKPLERTEASIGNYYQSIDIPRSIVVSHQLTNR